MTMISSISQYVAPKLPVSVGVFEPPPMVPGSHTACQSPKQCQTHRRRYIGNNGWIGVSPLIFCPVILKENSFEQTK